MQPKLLSFLLLIAFATVGLSQPPIEQTLLNRAASAATPIQKLEAIGNLAEFYFLYHADQKADSLLRTQIALAELSGDTSLLLGVLNNEMIGNLPSWSSSQTFDRALSLVEKGIEYSGALQNPLLELSARIRKSTLLRRRNLLDAAQQEVAKALALLNHLPTDSSKAALWIETGEVFLAKNDPATAYKYFNQAFDIGYSMKNTALQSAVLHCIHRLYRVNGEMELAKSSLLESLRINSKKPMRAYGLLEDYLALFKLTENLPFLERATQISDSLRSMKGQLMCKKLWFTYRMYVEKDSRSALKYLAENPDLQFYYKNEGNINYNIGAVYQYSGKLDSAVHYYQLARPNIVSAYDPAVQRDFFAELGAAYDGLGNGDSAIHYYQKAYSGGLKHEDNAFNAEMSASLAKLWAAKGDYRKAYEYNELHLGYNKRLNDLSHRRDVALLEIDRQKKIHEQDLLNATSAAKRKHDLQYTAITLVIAIIFVGLMILGLFPVNKTFIRMLGFFSFICLFEFIIILMDVQLVALTHHEPLPLWIAKIFIIALLVPFHHWLEHKVVQFASSDQWRTLRQRFHFKDWWRAKRQAMLEAEKHGEGEHVA